MNKSSTANQIWPSFWRDFSLAQKPRFLALNKRIAASRGEIVKSLTDADAHVQTIICKQWKEEKKPSVCCLLFTSGVSIRCFECSNKNECDAIDTHSTPPECNKRYVFESHEVRPEFDRCLRITDVGDIPVYKRVCGNQNIEKAYRDNCGFPYCSVLVCYSDKCIIWSL